MNKVKEQIAWMLMNQSAVMAQTQEFILDSNIPLSEETAWGLVEGREKLLQFSAQACQLVLFDETEQIKNLLLGMKTNMHNVIDFIEDVESQL